MSNLLKHSQFGEIRTERKGDDFLFCAKDVCEVLGIEWKGSHNLGHLDDDEMVTRKVYTPGGYQSMIFVTESGLYALIIRSNKPAARKFRKWITSEVLPSLRKYGVYSTDVKDIARAERKLEDRKIKQLLAAIDGGLSATDKRLVARQCQTDEYEVYDVLTGRRRDAHMLALLYARATGNKLLNKSFYTLEGAELLLNELNTQKNKRI